MRWGLSRLHGCLFVCLVSLLCVDAIPMPINKILNTLTRPRAENAAKQVPLRIFPVGASIVWGQGSIYGNGFRRGLRSALVKDGAQVNMVGSRKAGQMGDNENDGWPGLRISEVRNKEEVQASLGQKPNVVLLLVGTNDALQGKDPDTMANDIKDFISYILDTVSGTTVIVSTLPPNANTKAETIIKEYNSKLASTVDYLRNEGKHVKLVDSHSSWWSTKDLQSDGTHPSNDGYVKMARVFYDGIKSAQSWIKDPASTGLPLMGPGDPESIGDPPVLPVDASA